MHEKFCKLHDQWLINYLLSSSKTLTHSTEGLQYLALKAFEYREWSFLGIIYDMVHQIIWSGLLLKVTYCIYQHN